MIGTVLFVILTIGVKGLIGDEHGELSKLCYDCHDVDDPSKCHTMRNCGGRDHCSTEVHYLNGKYQFTLGCKDHHACDEHIVPAIGKRQRGHEHGDVVCRQCCDTNSCNKKLCGQFRNTVTTAATTAAMKITTATEAPATTTFDDCRDHQEDGLICAAYDQFNFCSDTSSFAYTIAHTKCPKHCGFCV